MKVSTATPCPNNTAARNNDDKTNFKALAAAFHNI
jgi:hypothetical protein